VLPDIVFLDINMPMMSGFEFLSEIKRVDHLSHIPIVIFTTSNSPEQIKQSRELGASAFLTKPANFDDLCSKLRSILVPDLIAQQKVAFEVI
jgi:CheY-like chemotaxis protein